MNISKEEKLMYKVMKSIYESGIPVSFKGSMVLKTCLLEAGYKDDTRHTVDIDANYNSETFPTIEQIALSFQNAIDKDDIHLYAVPSRAYKENQSAGFELRDKDTDEVIFTMDVDVNRPLPYTKIYEISGMRFRGTTPNQMIADKVLVVSGNRIFRRIKDVVDLYYMSKVFDFNLKEITDILKQNGKCIGNFEEFLTNREELNHAYEKFVFAGSIKKPTFDELYEAVKDFIGDAIKESNS